MKGRMDAGRRRLIGGAAVLVLFGAALVAALVAPGFLRDGGDDISRASVVSFRSTSDDRVTALERATVLITQYAGNRPLSIGSGTIIDGDEGLIVTNAHVGDPGAPGLAVQYLEYGGPEALPDRLVVSVFEAEDAPARDAYLAEVAASDGYLDLAVLRIASTLEGDRVAQLNLPAVPVGSSSALSNTDSVTIVGYPGVGGGQEKRINVSRGIVSGFQSDPRVTEPRGWVKTDAAIAHGNSGGLAADDEGNLVGVPTRLQCGSALDGSDCDPLGLPDVQGKLRPIDLAKPLIEAARTGTTWTSPYVVPKSGREKVTFLGWAPPDTAQGSCDFEKKTSYPTGAREVAAAFRWEGMTKGVDYLYVLVLNRSGQPSDWRKAASFPLRWENATPNGCDVISLANGAEPMPDGSYAALLYLGPSYDAVTDQAKVDIVNVGGDSQDPTPQTETETETVPVEEGDKDRECSAWTTENFKNAGVPLPRVERNGPVVAEAGIASLSRELGPAGGFATEAEAAQAARKAVQKLSETKTYRWLVLQVGQRYHAYEARIWLKFVPSTNKFGDFELVPNPDTRPCTIPSKQATLVEWHALRLVGVGDYTWVQYTWTHSSGDSFKELGGLVATSAEELLEMIPEAQRANCSPTTIASAEISAGYDCGLQGLEVSYTLYLTTSGLLQRYEDSLRELGVTAGQGGGSCPTALPSEGSWERGGAARGRLVCFVDTLGPRAMVWTHAGRRVLGFARSATLTSKELFDWWAQNAGPID